MAAVCNVHTNPKLSITRKTRLPMMRSYLLLIIVCLGRNADSKPNQRAITSKQASAYHNLVGDAVMTEGSGAMDVNVGPPYLKSPFPKRQDEENTCTPEYAAIRGHTMCLDDRPEMTSYGVSQGEQEDIVNLHNTLRGNVDPPATDLAKLVWDSRLAKVADKWARQCVMEHDNVRGIPEYGLQIGQNVAGGYMSWQSAIMAWYNEVSMYHFGEDPVQYLGRDGWKKIGHYTQIVQNVTFLVGCGFADCPNTEFGRFYVCNYASGQSNIPYPYTEGPRCSSCPDTCVDGLCDCGGKTCLNGGTLDVNTCTCACPALYTGPTCSHLNCPEKDSFYCGRSLVERDCRTYYNVPQLCPFMCGICESGSTNTTSPSRPRPNHARVRPVQPTRPSRPPPPTPSTFTSEHGCKYRGKRASKDECRNYGDHGNDMTLCESMGGNQVTCDHCQRFYNIKTDYCPVMCGLCDPPCQGKKCLNGGKLDTQSCKCTCKAPFEGDTCQTANCPQRDPRHCVLYKVPFCTKYINVPSECPFLCGTC